MSGRREGCEVGPGKTFVWALGFHASATFLSFFRTTTPQLSQKKSQKFLAQTPSRLKKVRYIECVILAGSSFSALFYRFSSGVTEVLHV